MREIISKIYALEKVFHAKGCSDEQVREAEKKLGFTLPEEYAMYVKEFGAISFFATEWTGLNVGGRINVVDATMKERELNTHFPKDCFVVENQAIDGIITVSNSGGKVFTVQHKNVVPLCDSLLEYLDICVSRK